MNYINTSGGLTFNLRREVYVEILQALNPLHDERSSRI